MEWKSVCRIKTLEQKQIVYSIRRSPKAGKGRGADNLYRGHFILNYIYNSKMALPGRSPWLPLWGSRQEKLSVCLVSKLHNCGVQKLKLLKKEKYRSMKSTYKTTELYCLSGRVRMTERRSPVRRQVIRLYVCATLILCQLMNHDTDL